MKSKSEKGLSRVCLIPQTIQKGLLSFSGSILKWIYYAQFQLHIFYPWTLLQLFYMIHSSFYLLLCLSAVSQLAHCLKETGLTQTVVKLNHKLEFSLLCRAVSCSTCITKCGKETTVKARITDRKCEVERNQTLKRQRRWKDAVKNILHYAAGDIFYYIHVILHSGWTRLTNAWYKQQIIFINTSVVGIFLLSLG